MSVSRANSRIAPRSFGLPRYSAIWIATALLFLIGWLAVPGSLSSSTLQTLLPFAGALMIASIGQLLVVQGGGLDLSVPGVIALTAMIVTRYSSLGIAPSVVIALALAFVTGIGNGVIVVGFGFSPIVATLAMNALLIGFVLKFTNGFAYSAPHGLVSAVSATVDGVPVMFIIAIAWTIGFSFLVRRTTWGRRLVATGVNRAAAYVLGIPVRLYAIGSYACGALCYGLVGVLLAGLLHIPGSVVGDPYLILTFAAVVLGGSPLLGGEGSVVATAVGALFLTQLNQLVLDAGASTDVQYLVEGGVIALSMAAPAVRLPQIIATRLAGRTTKASQIGCSDPAGVESQEEPVLSAGPAARSGDEVPEGNGQPNNMML